MNAPILILAAAEEMEAYRLTAGGWFALLASVGFVTALLAWCIWRVLRESSLQKLHSQIDKTPDMRQPEE